MSGGAIQQGSWKAGGKGGERYRLQGAEGEKSEEGRIGVSAPPIKSAIHTEMVKTYVCGGKWRSS